MKARDATHNDRDSIKQLYKDNSKNIGSFNLFWSWDKYIAKTAPHKFVVVEYDKEILGFVRWGVSKKEKCFVLHEIAVKNDIKQRGVGRMLFDQIPKPIMLKCRCDNKAGNSFYKAMGMTIAGKTRTKKGVDHYKWWIT